MTEDNNQNNSQDWSDDLLPRKPKLDDQEGTFMPTEKSRQPAEVRPTENFEPNLKPKKSHKGLIILLIILLILIALGVGGFFVYQKYSSQILSLVGIKNNQSEQKTEQKQEEQKDENNLIVEDMQRKAEIAKKEVQKKYSDAFIFQIEAIAKADNVSKIKCSLSDYKETCNNPTESYYIFHFGTLGCKKNSSVLECKKEIEVIIKVKLNENKIVKTMESKYGAPTFFPLKLETIKISYKKAFDILDKNGGKSFKEKYPNNIEEAYPFLQCVSENYAVWLLGYDDPSTHDYILKYIDAKNGKVMNNEDYEKLIKETKKSK